MGKELYLDYECEMDRGYGIEGISGTLYLEFDEHGTIVASVLMGMHDIMETKFEIEIDFSNEDFAKVFGAFTDKLV